MQGYTVPHTAMNPLKHPLLLVLVPLCIFVVVASFYRFLVAEDYIVEYEGACDPVIESCFVGCTDDECTESYYYTVVRKYAADVQAQCGVDFSDCEQASVCLETDRECEITYCDLATVTETETCEQIEGLVIPEVLPEEAVPEEEEEKTPEESVPPTPL